MTDTTDYNQSQIDRYKAANARLIAEHGTGCRASWVSGDIGRNNAMIKFYQEQQGEADGNSE